MRDPDVVVVGAGGGGPAATLRLAEAGLDVLVLEAGPFHGNEQWERPYERPGGDGSDDPADLSGELLEQQFTRREMEMIQKFQWGPADESRPAWFRQQPEGGLVLQAAGVGGTTLYYTGCHPRAYPHAVDDGDGWLLGYDDLVPYYRDVEATLDVTPAPTTHKEAMFYEGCEAAGYDLLRTKDVESVGYRPQPNAILRPDETLRHDGDYDGDFSDDDVSGDTLAGVAIQGNPHPTGADYDEKAQRSTNIGYVPQLLETGNVEIRPNAFVTQVHTDTARGDLQATGVTFRDTWSGSTTRIDAEAVVLAAGAIETPRLWLNSGLPENEWVGRGMTIHYGDAVTAVFPESVLEERIGQPTLDPYKGQQIAGRFDFPGLGCLQTYGGPPGIAALANYAGSVAGFADTNDAGDEPWDSRGKVVGTELKRLMAAYDRSVTLQVLTDDRPHRSNGVELGDVTDEHGRVPNVTYEASREDLRRRDEMARIAAEIFDAAGAERVHRLDSGPSAIHIHSTMRMGYVADEACEAYDVDRLFVADNSVLPNSLGGPNPTNTTQALATRTGERIVERYFPDRAARRRRA
jgi:choline dehydrogenase-like flavoprotein